MDFGRPMQMRAHLTNHHRAVMWWPQCMQILLELQEKTFQSSIELTGKLQVFSSKLQVT